MTSHTAPPAGEEDRPRGKGTAPRRGRLTRGGVAITVGSAALVTALAGLAVGGILPPQPAAAEPTPAAAIPTTGVAYNEGTDFSFYFNNPRTTTFDPSGYTGRVLVVTTTREGCATCDEASLHAALRFDATADRRVVTVPIIVGLPSPPPTDLSGEASFTPLAIGESPRGPYGRLPVPTTIVIGPDGRPAGRITGGLDDPGRLRRLEIITEEALDEAPPEDFPAWVLRRLPGVAARPRVKAPGYDGSHRDAVVIHRSASGRDHDVYFVAEPGSYPWVQATTGTGSAGSFVPSRRDRVRPFVIWHEGREEHGGGGAAVNTVIAGVASSEVVTVTFLDASGQARCAARVDRNVFVCEAAPFVPSSVRVLLRDGTSMVSP